MKTHSLILLMAATFACAYAHAQTSGVAPRGSVDYCSGYAHVVDSAITIRNMGLSPQNAYNQIKSFYGVGPEDKKKIINNVYFNPALREIIPGDTNLLMAIIQSCESGWKQPKPFEPLR